MGEKGTNCASQLSALSSQLSALRSEIALLGRLLLQVPTSGYWVPALISFRNFPRSVRKSYPLLVGAPPNKPTPDYEIQPSSDYGTLGPNSDVKMDQSGSTVSSEGPTTSTRPGLSFKLADSTTAPRPTPPSPQSIQAIRIVSLIMGATLALAIGLNSVMRTRRAENELMNARYSRGSASARRSSPRYDAAAQKEAEQLLARVARNDSTAIVEVQSRSAAWRGRIQLTPQLTSLITAGLNANDLPARAATIQADLAAMNVAEDESSVDRLASQAESPDHATRIWAIWTLGLLANRGLETEHIVSLLTAHLSDNDIESRHWAAEALSYTGSDASIPPLLKAMHDDPSPLVRERAACGLAESGMLTKEQRRTTIPTLLAYTDDSTLDSATHAWTYHALRDITAQRLPDDSAAWRRWYENEGKR